MSQFKARCLRLLDDVARTGDEVLVTKRGKPLARVVPVESPPGLQGSVRFLVSDDALVEPTGEAWDAESD